MRRSFLFVLVLLACGCAGADAVASGQVEPAGVQRGPVTLFSGSLMPLVSFDDPRVYAEGVDWPLGWHMPGREYVAGDGWWALLCRQECRLERTVLAVTAAKHGVYDGEPVESQLLQWSPLPELALAMADGAAYDGDGQQLLALFHLGALSSRITPAPGRVTTWLHAGMPAYPDGGRLGTAETRFRQGDGRDVRLVPRLHEGDATHARSLLLELHVAGQRQTLGQFEFYMDEFQVVPARDYLPWAGDLDADGKVDLLVRFRGSEHVVLFLSSLAAPGELVGEAGRFDYYDPSSAGC